MSTETKQPTQRTPLHLFDARFSSAKRLYAEMFGDAVATNSYLKITVLVLSILLLALVFTQVRISNAISQFRPLVIRIDEIGRAEAIKLSDARYTPREPEIKYFLSQFVHLYYSRSKVTLKDSYNKSLFFLDEKLAGQVEAAWTKNKTIDEYINSSMGDIEVDVQGVAIEDLREAPYKARVDFDMVFYSPIQRVEIQRKRFTAHFVFRFYDGILAGEILRINPLGLVIDYFREDQFK
jgi:type IV secretion system protein VirB5